MRIDILEGKEGEGGEGRVLKSPKALVGGVQFTDPFTYLQTCNYTNH